MGAYNAPVRPTEGLPERYQVLEVVGSGMTGIVYRARDGELGREVAIKVLRPSECPGASLGRLAREAEILARGSHEAMVPLLDADLEAPNPYLVLAWMEGGDLASRLRQEGVPPPEWTLRAGRRLASALAELHARDILHRDVKTANVLLDGEGEAYLADLGLGRPAEADPLTRTGYVVGTPRYMAPELLAGGEYTPSTDLYSLGVVLLELSGLGGERGLDPTPELRDAEIEALPDRGLGRVLKRCLARSPGLRPASAEELVDRLERLSDDASRRECEEPGDATEILPASAQTLELPIEASREPPLRRGGVLGVLGILLALGFVLAAERPPPGPGMAKPAAPTSPPRGSPPDSLAAARARLPSTEAARALERLDVASVGVRSFVGQAAPFVAPEVDRNWERFLGRLVDRLRGEEAIPIEDLRYAGEFLLAFDEVERQALRALRSPGPTSDLSLLLADWRAREGRIVEVSAKVREALVAPGRTPGLGEWLLAARLAFLRPTPADVPAVLAIAREGGLAPRSFLLAGDTAAEMLGLARKRRLVDCAGLLELAGVLSRMLLRLGREGGWSLRWQEALLSTVSRSAVDCRDGEVPPFRQLAEGFLDEVGEVAPARLERAIGGTLYALERRRDRLGPEGQAYLAAILARREALGARDP